MPTGKKILTIFLAFVMTFFSVTTANAASLKDSDSTGKILYKSENGNQVVELKNDKNKKSYIVVSAPVTYNDLSDEEQLKKSVNSADQEIIGQRWYLNFTDDLNAAKQAADVNPTEQGKTTFWHNSYIDTWWSLANGPGFHLYLSPIDTSFITNASWIAADGLAGALVVTGVVTGGAGAVIAAIATMAVITVSWALQNNDGSIDIYSPNSSRYDNTSVEPNQYLGTARNQANVWKNFTWPSYAPAFSN